MPPRLRPLLIRAPWLRTLAALVALVAGLYALAALGRHLEAPAEADGRLRAVLFINGTLGDKSFFDAAARGLRQAGATLPVRVKVVEGGTDPTRWQAALTDLADSGDHDLIVAGTFTLVPQVERLAREYPRTRFVVYDAAVDPARCACPNVQSILFRQNEGAYLAGWLAARLDQAGLPDLPGRHAEEGLGAGLGIVGGMQFPVIDDFIIGFRAGVQAAVPGLPVMTQYANGFSDPAIGKEIAKAQFGRGARIVFHAAGATGQGVNEAALEARRYAIGVDTDQVALYRRANPALAARIITSVVKNVDVAVVRAIEHVLRERDAGGPGLARAPMQMQRQSQMQPQVQSLGVAEGGVGLAMTSPVLDAAPPALLAELARVQAEVASGRRVVPGAFHRERDTP